MTINSTYMFQTKVFGKTPKWEIESRIQILINPEQESITIKAEADFRPLRKYFKNRNFLSAHLSL